MGLTYLSVCIYRLIKIEYCWISEKGLLNFTASLFQKRQESLVRLLPSLFFFLDLVHEFDLDVLGHFSDLLVGVFPRLAVAIEHKMQP